MKNLIRDLKQRGHTSEALTQEYISDMFGDSFLSAVYFRPKGFIRADVKRISDSYGLDVLLNGFTWIVVSWDDPKDIETLTYDKYLKGFDILRTKHPEHYMDMITGNYDVVTCDALLECAIYGEIIYG